MSRKRKLPRCAYCGESLIRKGRILLEYGDLSGNPEIGWCQKCVGADRLFQALLPDGDIDHPTRNLAEVLAEIGNRGHGRLVIG